MTNNYEAEKEAMKVDATQLKSQAADLRNQAALLQRRANGLEAQASVLLGQELRPQPTQSDYSTQQGFDEANYGLIGGGHPRI